MNPTLIKIGLISFFADVSSEFLYPLTPIFLSTILGANALSIGLIEGCAEAAASLLKTVCGKWSDQIQKRKPFVWIGYLLATLAKPLTGIAHHWTAVFIARVLDRTGKGIRTAPRDAMIAEVVNHQEMGMAYGFHRGMDTLGAVLGPLLALVCLSLFHDQIRPLFFLAIIPGLISIWLALSLPETGKSLPAQDDPARKIKISNLPKKYIQYLCIWGLFTLVNSSDAFLILRAKQTGLSTTHSVLLYAFFNLIYAGGSYPLGKLSDRIDRKIILVFGLFLFAGTYLGFSVADQPFHFWILFGLYGLFMAMTDGVGKAFAMDMIPPEMKATAMGVLGTVTGLTTLFASVVAGFLWDHVSPASAFIYGAIGAVLAGVILLFFKRSN